jgi:hypothetical protein
LLNCRKLKKLDIVGIKKLTEVAFEGLQDPTKATSSALPSLERLNLTMCDAVSDRLLV